MTYRLITDRLGSVRLVVNANSGAVAQRLDYDEFGAARVEAQLVWLVAPHSVIQPAQQSRTEPTYA